MKIREYLPMGGSSICTVSQYIEGCFNIKDTSDGIAESGKENAKNAQESIARLCEVLANKGVLNIKDISYIAAGYIDNSIEEVED